MSDADGDDDGNGDRGVDRDRDLRTAVERFLDGAETVYGEYERGYVDADAALGVLERHVADLRAAAEGNDGAGREGGAGDGEVKGGGTEDEDG